MHKVLSVLFIMFLTSCESNIEVIRNLGELKDAPIIAAETVEILYSDSAKIRLRITAPEINRYNKPDKFVTEFPKGLTVEQFDDSLRIIAYIRANYAIYHEKLNLWEAHNNVMAKNMLKNEELHTEELFWDQNKGVIYSSKFSKIINEDGVFYGDAGFEAKEDLSRWHMRGIRGKVNVKEQMDGQ